MLIDEGRYLWTFDNMYKFGDGRSSDCMERAAFGAPEQSI